MNYCGFNIEPFCSDVCGDHRRPQTLAEICRNMGICCGFRAVAAREKYSGFILLTRRGSAPPGDSATRITGIALGPIFFAPRRGIVCLWTEISYIWHPDATLIKQNAGHNRVNCNRISRAAVYDIQPGPPGDSAGQKIALIATGL